MRDVIPGQVWEDKQGNRMKLVTMPDGTVGARSVFHPNHPTRAGQFKEHYPAIGINPVVFAQHHDLVEEPGGIEVKPPTPPPAPEFRVGDVVRLKCGGPPMVVVGVQPSHDNRLVVRTCWHCADGNVTGNEFHPEVLVPSAVAMDLGAGDACVDRD